MSNYNPSESSLIKNLYEKAKTTLNRETLTDGECEDVISDLSKCRIELRDIASEDAKSNMDIFRDIHVWLLYMLAIFSRIKEACQLIAEKDISCQNCEIFYRDSLPAFIKNRMSENRLSDIIIDGMMDSCGKNYDEYMEWFYLYNRPGNFAKLLIYCARQLDRKTDTIVLSKCIFETRKKENSEHRKRMLYGIPSGIDYDYAGTGRAYADEIFDYAELLSDLAYTNDYYEIRKCINDSMKKYKHEMGIYQNKASEWLPYFWTSMMRCLNKIERYDRTIELAEAMDLPIKRGDYYYCVAEAFYLSGNLEKSRIYCERSAALRRDKHNTLLLAYIMFADEKYDASEKLLIEYIATENLLDENIYFDGFQNNYSEVTTSRIIHEAEYHIRLKSPYLLLFLCYVRKKEFVKAKLLIKKIKETASITDLSLISEYIMDMENDKTIQLDELERQNELLQSEISEAKENYLKIKDTLSQVTARLVECQLTEDSRELVTTDYWEDNISQKMNDLIDGLVADVQKTSPDEYEKKIELIKEKYPYLHKDASRFLASAEQFYDVFSGNIEVDFSPITVEYCRVIETSLWFYLDKTDEYKYEIQKNINKTKTLGSAKWAIEQSPKKTLGKYIKTLERLKLIRNKSAHRQMTKEDPDVIWIRDLIWNSSFLKDLSVRS